jgi:hypothetical protein
MMIRIRHASDSMGYVNIEIEGLEGTFTVYPNRRNTTNGMDSTFTALREVVNRRILMPAKNQGDGQLLIHVKGFGILISRSSSRRYELNNIPLTINDILNNLTRVLLRSIYINNDAEGHKQLWDYFHRCVKMPAELSYVLENRVPYKFVDENNDVKECRLNVAQIGPQDFALELNDAFWYDISLKELRNFTNSYLKDSRRGQFYAVSPEELVFILNETRVSDAQAKVMKAFMTQNRQSDAVEKRAMELLKGLSDNYERISLIKFQTQENHEIQDSLLVRGKLTDWIIADNGMKRGFQDVSTYMVYSVEQGQSETHPLIKLNKLKGVDDNMLLLRGPICIDNMMSGASKGDQYAARAMAVMNDHVLGTYVSTVRGHLDNITKGNMNAGRVLIENAM